MILKIFLPKKSAKKFAFLTRNKAKLLKNDQLASEKHFHCFLAHYLGIFVIYFG
jgi:hypothetical protein